MKAKSSKFFKIIAFLLCFLLCIEQSGFAQIAGQLDISGHLADLRNAFAPDVFRPLHLRYLQYNSLNNNFQLFLDKGSLKNPQTQELENTTKELLNYFFIGVTLPNDTFWVNLRPDSPDNIIDDYLAQTDVGKILLESDLQLKKDTAKFTSPETPEGREYWDKLYRRAGEIFGSSNITIPTLTRPWIVPDEIIIRETLDSAYIYKATLKVMLEQDYLKDSAVYNFKDDRLKELNEYSSQLIREFIIPKLTKEINSSKRYAPLRQVYYSLIMAQWFKARYYGKGGLYSHLINRKDLTNLTSKESWSKTTYFKEYRKSFKDGEYNIQEPIYTPYGQTIRSYFSGGISGIAPEIPAFGSSPVTDPKTGAKITSVPTGSSPLANNHIIAVKVGTNAPDEDEVEIETNPDTPASSPLAAQSDYLEIEDRDPGRLTHDTTETGRHAKIEPYFNDTLLASLPHQSPLIIELGMGGATTPRPSPTFFELHDTLKRKFGSNQFKLIGIDNNPQIVHNAQNHITRDSLSDVGVILGSFSTVADKFEGSVDLIRCFAVLHYYDKPQRDLARSYFTKALSEGGIFIEGGFDSFMVYKKQSGVLVPIRLGLVKEYILGRERKIGELLPDLKYAPTSLISDIIQKKASWDTLDDYEYVNYRDVVVFSLNENGYPVQRDRDIIEREKKYAYSLYIDLRQHLRDSKNPVELNAEYGIAQQLISDAFNNKTISERWKLDLLSRIKLDKELQEISLRQPASSPLSSASSPMVKFDIETMFEPYKGLPQNDFASLVDTAYGVIPEAPQGEMWLSDKERHIAESAMLDFLRTAGQDQELVVTIYGPGRDLIELKTVLELAKDKQLKIKFIVYDYSTRLLEREFKDLLIYLGDLSQWNDKFSVKFHYADLRNTKLWDRITTPSNITFMRRTWVWTRQSDLFGKFDEFMGMLKKNIPRGALIVWEPKDLYSPMETFKVAELINSTSSLGESQESGAASPMAQKITETQMIDNPGGIDFRSLPIVTQAIGNLSRILRDSPALAGQSLLKVNLDEEWRQIERMASSGITPSSERIKEYVQTSCAQDNIIQDRDKILLCISDILRLEEERCDSTDATLRDILIVLESGSSVDELKEIFLGKVI